MKYRSITRRAAGLAVLFAAVAARLGSGSDAGDDIRV